MSMQKQSVQLGQCNCNDNTGSVKRKTRSQYDQMDWFGNHVTHILAEVRFRILPAMATLEKTHVHFMFSPFFVHVCRTVFRRNWRGRNNMLEGTTVVQEIVLYKTEHLPRSSSPLPLSGILRVVQLVQCSSSCVPRRHHLHEPTRQQMRLLMIAPATNRMKALVPAVMLSRMPSVQT